MYEPLIRARWRRGGPARPANAVFDFSNTVLRLINNMTRVPTVCTTYVPYTTQDGWTD